MIKKNKRTLVAGSIVILLPILLGLFLWDRLPDQMVTHWGFDGTPNGWSSKTFAVFGLPLFLLVIHWICTIATSADPKNKNLNPKMMKLIFWICPIVSVFCSVSIYAEALGLDFNIEMIGAVFTSVVFIVIGNYLPKCQQNYTVGIKLPWTLHSTENWNRTHRFAGPVWIICGILMFFSLFMKSEALMLTVILVAVLLPTLYSYFYYVKHEKC